MLHVGNMEACQACTESKELPYCSSWNAFFASDFYTSKHAFWRQPDGKHACVGYEYFVLVFRLVFFLTVPERVESEEATEYFLSDHKNNGATLGDWCDDIWMVRPGVRCFLASALDVLGHGSASTASLKAAVVWHRTALKRQFAAAALYVTTPS